MKKFLVILLTIVMTASVLTACGSTGGTTAATTKAATTAATTTAGATTAAATTAAGGDVIKFGGIHDISGAGSVLGNATVQGHKIAIDEINKAGGFKVGDKTYKIDLIVYDCKSDPNEGISAFKRLAEVDKVPIVLGPPLSNVGLAVAPYTTQYKLSFLGQFGDPRCLLGEKLDTLNPYMFLMQPSATQSGIIAGAYMIEKLGLKKPGLLIAQDHSYCSTQANAFIKYCKDKGIEIVGTEYNKQADIDMKTQLTNLKNKGCDFIFNANPTQPLVISTNQKYQLGINIPQTGSLDYSAPFATLVSDPKSASNIYFASNVDYNAPKYVDLNKKCQAMFKADATVKTALGYDEVLIAVAAMQKAGSVSDREAITKALETVSGVKTVITDNFAMDPKTHMPLGLEMCINKIDNAVYKMEGWYVPSYLK